MDADSNCDGDCVPICNKDIDKNCKCGDLTAPCDQSTYKCLDEENTLVCLPACISSIAVNCHFGNGLICDIEAGDTYTDICNKECDGELISVGDPCKCG